MSDNIRPSDSRETAQDSRKSYSTPKLKEFGPVGALTQGGVSGIAEAQANMNKTRRV